MAIDLLTYSVGNKTYSQIEALFDDIYKGVENATDFSKILKEEALFFMNRVYDELVRAHGGPWNQRMPTGVGHLFRRSGRGLREIYESIRINVDKGDLTASMNISGYMITHEEGAIISVKNAKYLTIPLPAALTTAGMRQRISSRGFKNTFIQKSRNGNLLIFQRRAGGRVVPLYLLKKTTYIPARLNFQKTFESQLPYFEERIFERISAELDKIK
jgi:hypothetical protein